MFDKFIIKKKSKQKIFFHCCHLVLVWSERTSIGYDFIGKHIYDDIYEISDSVINDNSFLINLMREGVLN